MRRARNRAIDVRKTSAIGHIPLPNLRRGVVGRCIAGLMRLKTCRGSHSGFFSLTKIVIAWKHRFQTLGERLRYFTALKLSRVVKAPPTAQRQATSLEATCIIEGSERWMSGLNRTPGKRVYVSKRTAGSNPALSARTRPANSLSRVVRRSEPRTTRGFALWAPDCPHGHPPPKSASNPDSSQNLLTFCPRYGGRGLEKNWGFDAVPIAR